MALPGRMRQGVELLKMAKASMQEVCATLWPDEQPTTSIFALSNKLKQAPLEFPGGSNRLPVRGLGWC